jgi:hypothetical protein
MALIAFERRAVLYELHGRLAVWTGENLEELGVDGHDASGEPEHYSIRCDPLSAVGYPRTGWEIATKRGLRTAESGLLSHEWSRCVPTRKD